MGLVVGIRYLCGWAMATDPADREKAEWPPHPDRIFMALAAAHFETDGGPEEYEALRRLSALGPPSLSASGASPRQVVTTFVPVNDDANPAVSPMPSGSLAIGRIRQARSFPVAIPERDEVFLIWDGDVSPADRGALDRLCRKVAAVGHSASLVQMWVADDPPEPTLVPAENFGGSGLLGRTAGRTRLRVSDTSRLDSLEGRYRDSLRPETARSQVYEAPAPTASNPVLPGSAFDPRLIVLRRIEGRPLGLPSTLLLTEALRGAILNHTNPVPDWISGHDGPDGPPARKTHLALFPLAHVGREHADGGLLGVALALPKDGISFEECEWTLRAFLYENGFGPAEQTLYDGHLFQWKVALEDRADVPQALRPETWTAAPPRSGAERWASVTPVVLDRYPKGKTDAQRMVEVEETVRRACPRAGLPEPEKLGVVATPAPPFVGVPHARAFPALVQGGKRFHVHVILTFPGPVVGPVLLGAGRYRGYGLLRPWEGSGR